MDLFDGEFSKLENLLPKEGEVSYWGGFIPEIEASAWMQRLYTTLPWKHDRLKLFGKEITTKRKVAWYGDKPFSYTYSGQEKIALPWTKELLELKKKVEDYSGESYNSCLINLYEHGEEAMSWHSDNEPELKKEGTIASLSLGASRKFMFKHKHDKITRSILLENGSLLLMKTCTQEHWLHRLPPTTRVKQPRINLTFRTVQH